MRRIAFLNGRFLNGRVLLLILTAAVVAPSLGCVGLGSHIMYIFTGPPKVPAKFDGLKGKRVAVVCVPDVNTIGRENESLLLARRAGRILDEKVRGITIVPYEDVEKWIDGNELDHTDYRAIGKGVKADIVLAIDMDAFRIQEGSTLYRGRGNLKVKVYDMQQGGKIVYENYMPDIAFPRDGGRPSADITATRFRQSFITYLAEDITRLFYDYERMEGFSRSSNLSDEFER